MKRNDEISQLRNHNPQLLTFDFGEDGGRGLIVGLDSKKAMNGAKVVWSWGGGWDHVSVSFENRCPTWEEMCKVKDMFFYPDECCVEYHPKESEYVNQHPYCLHIWRPQGAEMPTPPRCFV